MRSSSARRRRSWRRSDRAIQPAHATYRVAIFVRGMGIRGMQRRRAFAALVAAACGTAFALAAMGARPEAAAEEATLSAAPPGGPQLQATIRRDTHGIPHILAADFAGMGFGYGYAIAEDNICTLAETYVTVRAERSRYEGDGVE